MKALLIIVIIALIGLALWHFYWYGYNNGAKAMVNAIDDELENIQNEKQEKETNTGDNEKQEDTQTKE